VLIPQKALSYAYGIYKVFALNDSNKLREREVRVGDRIGQNVEVISGVEEGDRLALPTEGQELVMHDGISVKIVGQGTKRKSGSDVGDR
jgi:hypothetical protein